MVILIGGIALQAKQSQDRTTAELRARIDLLEAQLATPRGDTQTMPVLRAQKIELVDVDGRVRASLGFGTFSNTFGEDVELVMSGKNGKPGVRLRAGDYDAGSWGNLFLGDGTIGSVGGSAILNSLGPSLDMAGESEGHAALSLLNGNPSFTLRSGSDRPNSLSPGSSKCVVLSAGKSGSPLLGLHDPGSATDGTLLLPLISLRGEAVGGVRLAGRDRPPC